MASIAPAPPTLSRSLTSPSLHPTRKQSAHRLPRGKVSNTQGHAPQVNQLQPNGSQYINLSMERMVAQCNRGLIQRFSERLDRWRDVESLPEDQRYNAALDLVKEYRTLLEDEVSKLKRQHGENYEARQRRLWKRRLQPSTSISDDEPEQLVGNESEQHALEELQRCEQEHQIWCLFEELIPIRYPATTSPGTQETVLPGTVHGNSRFAADGDDFTQFIQKDGEARERLVVMKWLEECSGRSGSPEIIEDELEKRSKRGKDLWSSGWINTREKIKSIKRLRSWDTSTDTLPHLPDSQGNAIVQQLDPDAVTRLQLALDPQDQDFNNAFWLICFEHLRRGLPMDKLLEWCELCNETATAVTLGMFTEVNEGAESGSNAVARYRWRKTCLAAASQRGLHASEAAVFGLLGGDLRSVEGRCADWKDLCHAHLNADIIGRYRSHIKDRFNARLPPDQLHNFGDRQPLDLGLNLDQTISSVKEHHLIRSRASTYTSSSVIQMALISDTLPRLLMEQGAGLAYEAVERNDYIHPGSMVPPNQSDLFSNIQKVQKLTGDPEALRILTHIFIVFRLLGVRYAHGQIHDLWSEAAENVCAWYVQLLYSTQDYHLIPVYACNVHPDLGAHVTAKTMTAIQDDQQRAHFLRSMEECHMDVFGILDLQMQYAFGWFTNNEELDEDVAYLQLLEDAEGPMWPGKRIQSSETLELTDREEILLSCGEWFTLAHGEWFNTFNSLLQIMEHFLYYGRVQTAVELVRRASPKNVSTRKALDCLGVQVDVFEEILDPSPQLDRSTAQQIKILHRQALMYEHCTLLVEAIEAMWEWRLVEDRLLNSFDEPQGARQNRTDLLRAIDRVKNNMERVLSPGFLMLPSKNPQSLFPDEHAEAYYVNHEHRLQMIREAYFPELVIAYNSALQSAGHLISRDNFINHLELGRTVSENEELIRCFQQVMRMRELVTCLALTSKAMLTLNEQKPHHTKQRGKGPKTLGIWDIKS